MEPTKVIYWQGLMRSVYCPMPDQARDAPDALDRSKLPAAVVVPSNLIRLVTPAASAYFVMVSAPSSSASSPKTMLQDLVRPVPKEISPWYSSQVIYSPLMASCCSHRNVRVETSGILSMAAAAVTSLKMEPGT